ncbi:MAG: hypothetical protein C0402_12915 [Thermodesulfovibrio sp.]|nr:hypothetical protein [Thermodesulfovibrio sp.]
MRITNLSSSVIPLYLYEERTDNNAEKASNREPLQNPPALRYNSTQLPEEKNRFNENPSVLHSLSRYALNSNAEPPAVISPVYSFDKSIFQSNEQLFSRVRRAYESLNSTKNTGLYVDKLV